MNVGPVTRIGKFLTAVSLAIYLATASYGSTILLPHAGAHFAATTSEGGPDTNGWG
jgi:hypothetical protein